MRVMIFCDLENFRHSVIGRLKSSKKVDINFQNFHTFLFKKITEKIGSKMEDSRLIRAYIYTGQYTDSQINRAKKHLVDSIPIEQRRISNKIVQLESKINCENTQDAINKFNNELKKEKSKLLTQERIDLLREEIENAKKRKNAQEFLFKNMDCINFLELKLKPLKYSLKDMRFIQKGTDVEMAVDMVNFAHFDNYDIAIICTGDLDLLESCKLIKTLGKTFVLVSSQSQVSDKMIQASDYYFDINKLSEEELQQIAAEYLD